MVQKRIHVGMLPTGQGDSMSTQASDITIAVRASQLGDFAHAVLLVKRPPTPDDPREDWTLQYVKEKVDVKSFPIEGVPRGQEG